MVDEVRWEEIAAWYDAKQGEQGDLWHRYLIDPGLLSLVGRVRGLAVLDLACGNGYLARRYAREGAASVVGVDASAPIIALARRREAASPLGVRYEVRDAAHLTGFANASFDLVASNMAIMDIENGEGAVREAGRMLRTGGRFVFSICHPCFDLNERSMWEIERPAYESRVWRKVSNYRLEGAQWGAWRLGEGRFGRTKGYHRTLSTYARYLSNAGLLIRRLVEPAPQPKVVAESPQGEFLKEVPLHLVIEAVRIDVPLERVGRSAATPRGSRTSARTTRRGGRPSGSRGHRPGSGSARRGSIPGS
jgi:SAM-dependent methyltransferase